MFVCEGDAFIFPWRFTHFTLDSTVALTYVKDKQRKIILQKHTDSVNVELNDPRLRYTTNSIILRHIGFEDEGLYSFYIQPNPDAFPEVSLKIRPQPGNTD